MGSLSSSDIVRQRARASSRVRKNFVGRSIALLAAGTVFVSPAWADTYTYDQLGRLTKVSYDNGGYIEYAYDPAGNRTIVRISTAGEVPPLAPDEVIVLPLLGYAVVRISPEP